MKKLLEAAVESVQSAMDTKHHTLRVEIPEVPVMLQVDPVRLTQVLTNLLTNAAKYTPDGGMITRRVPTGRSGTRPVCTR